MRVALYVIAAAIATAAIAPEALNVATRVNDRTSCAILALDAYNAGYSYSEEYDNCMR
ncbi:hypothetical protein [Synechococcus elongatus]|uniref:hypothetical protein n=1 Tax=Synechococcus elongatus TaxID=32046 RepID=UPI001374DA25|nr:hypothetical protein [Synechococcus elongatus]